MQIYNSLADITESDKGAVIAIGNFDGVHRGHQALIDKAKEVAAKANKKVGILTFEPHPRELFQPDQPPARLTPFDIKVRRLKTHDIDALYSLPFDCDFASQSAEDFIQNILVEGLNAHHIVIGHDFHFGQMRKGNAQTIIDTGLSVSIVDAVHDATNETISSSRVREYLKKAEIEKANALLGWEWEIEGEVVKGDQRGRELGYPTANLLLGNTLHPSYGVYACRVKIEGEDDWLPAATNIGIRPMFEVETGQVEAHILDFPFREIYGKKLRVRPVQKLRSEAKFDSLEALVAQMDKDCQNVQSIFLSNKE